MSQAEQKNRAIREAATALFNEHGLDSVSVEDIAKAAGVSKPTIYTRFKTKEALFTDILIRECQKQLDKMFESRDESQSIESFIFTVVVQYLSFFTNTWQINLIRNAIYYARRFPEIGVAFMESGPQQGADKLASVLKAEMDRGALLQDDPAQAATFLLNQCKGELFFKSMLAIPVKSQTDEIEVEALRITTMFFRLYGHHSISSMEDVL